MADKAIKTDTKTSTFTSEDKVVTNIQVLELFERTFFPYMSSVGNYTETLVKVAETHESLDLKLSVSSGPKAKGSVYPVNIPAFAQTALTAIQNYRIIHQSNVDGIYRVIKDLSKDPGIYVVAYENRPRFKIEIEPTNGLVIGPMTFRECEGPSTFVYTPDLEVRPRQLTIETCVAERAKGKSGVLAKRIFREFHTKFEEKCLEAGMIPVEE